MTMRWVLLAALVVGCAVACSEPFGEASRPLAIDDPLTVRPANATCIAPAAPTSRIRLEPAYTGFEMPVAMLDRPDLGLTYVVEMPGRVKTIDHATGAVAVALDITDEAGGVPGYEEYGIYGVAVHPTRAEAYVTVERNITPFGDIQNRTELVRFTSHDASRTFDRTTEELVARVDRPSIYHFAGTVIFGQDGRLYMGVGDGGASLTNYDTTGTLLGTITRFDVDAPGGIVPEVFARGLRNPWKFSFDRATGELWAGDVGEIMFEEIDKIEQGKNYGWPVTEGFECHTPRVGCDPTGITPPVFAYPRAGGSSVTGGYVYRGTALPDLTGKYVFGDFSRGDISALIDGKGVLLNRGGIKPLISSFGEDAAGELYVLAWDSGIIYRIVAGEPEGPPVLPPRLSQTGCVDAADPTRPASGLIPYDVNVALWSDGAQKRRFLAIPDGTTIHVEDDGDFTLPEGGVLVKEFSLGGKRIETRLLVHHAGGDWTGATYEWNDDETEAFLLDDTKTKTLPNGATWTFPSPTQCFVCHTKAARIALGVEAAQLNRDLAYGSHSVNELAKLADIGILDTRLDPTTTTRLPPLASDAPVEDRARAYLHANCSGCHRKGGGTPAPMDFRFTVPKSELAGCAASSVDGRTDVHVLTPGDPSSSAVFLRMSRRDNYQMPPLGTRLVDDNAVSIIESWIGSMDDCGDD